MTAAKPRTFIFPLLLMAALLAGNAYGEAPEKREIESLVRKLGDDHFAVRKEAEEALKKIGETVEKPLKEYRNHPDPEVRFRVEGVLDHLASLRRELKRFDPKFEGKGDYVSKITGQGVKLTFRNLSKQPVRIFWIDPNGARKPWRDVLKSGETAVCERSFKSHVWLITDTDLRPLGLYRIDMDDPVIAIREETLEK